MFLQVYLKHPSFALAEAAASSDPHASRRKRAFYCWRIPRRRLFLLLPFSREPPPHPVANLSPYCPSIPFFRPALGGFGPSHTEKSTWPKAAPAIVSLSLPLIAKVVPVPGM